MAPGIRTTKRPGGVNAGSRLYTQSARWDRAEAESRLSWLRDRFDEFTGDEAPADIPGGIPMALVLQDRVLMKVTTGTWTHEG